MESRKFFVVAVLAVAAWAQAAWAGPIPVVNYDTVMSSQGTLVAGPTVENFNTAGLPGQPTTVGTIANTVFFNAQTEVYTYVHDVTPQNSQNIREFNSSFAPLGFNNIAGYSFSDGDVAGVDFTVVVNDFTGAVEYKVNTGTWDAGETITFFFESTVAPGPGGIYNILSTPPGSGLSFQPIPAPAALYGGMMLMGLVVATRRRGR